MKMLPTKYQPLAKILIKGFNAFLFGIMLMVLSGCESIKYYSQAIGGHSQIIFNQQGINEVLADPSVDESLKQQLRLSQEVLAFARSSLSLPKSKSYMKYVDTGRDYVVWNVVATPAYSVEPKVHCFPIAGCVSYRGFYALDDAKSYALSLSNEGLDVSIGSVTAYSTLGWFNDPLLNTMLTSDDVALAGTLIHELTHQQVYVKGDTAFNESFATAVEELGLQQWLRRDGKEAQWQRYQYDKEGRQQVIELILNHRALMASAYSALPEGAIDKWISLKEKLFLDLKNAYYQLRAQNLEYDRFDHWFRGDLNNASLALFADYNQWVPAFMQLRSQSHSWPQFYAAVDKLAGLDSRLRDKRLQQLKDNWLAQYAD